MVYLLHAKSEVHSIFFNFHAYVGTQFGIVIKFVRTDNAKEFMNVLSSKGREHHKSCVDTPQQNEVVEREHRHILETDRALFFQANLSPPFWGECILCGVHIINRMPLTVLETTVHILLFHKAPTLEHFKVFGCLCFVSTPKHNRVKFELRANPHVFIGYSPGQRGYKVLNLCTQKVTIQEMYFMNIFLSTYPLLSLLLLFNFLPTSTNFIPYIDLPEIFQHLLLTLIYLRYSYIYS